MVAVVADKNAKSVKSRFGIKAFNPFASAGLGTVGRTAEFKRIFHLPRRQTWIDLSEALTLALALPPRSDCSESCVCRGTGSMRLRPLQAWALSEFFEVRGGVAPLGVGHGKTLLSFLIPTLLEWERPMVLIPAGLRDKTIARDFPKLARHWKSHRNLDVRSYEELSRVEFADYLSKRRMPDGIIADEVHKLKNRGAARTKRLFRYFGEQPSTEFVGMSGSIVHRSVMDYGHLTLLGLKDTAPLPHGFIELRTWADLLDEGVADQQRPEAGAMLDFCNEGEAVRSGYRRRLTETKGVITSTEQSAGHVGLEIKEAPTPEAPKDIIDAFIRLRNSAELPNGEMCATVLEQNRHAKELALGFYYIWLWPDGKRDVEWLDARKAWKKFVRKMTSRSHGGEYYDTELQVANGVRAGDLVCDDNEYAMWVAVRDARRAVWGTREPPKKAVWISEYMLEAVEQWVRDNHTVISGATGLGGIVWVESIGFLEKLKERGHPCFFAGDNTIEDETGNRTVFASLAHAVGKNLQQFSKMCFSTPLTSGKALEQALGREHRPNQLADVVEVSVFLPCRECWWSFENSRRDGRYIEDTLGTPQLINKATVFVSSEEDVALKHDRGDPLWAPTGLARMDKPFAPFFATKDN